MSLIQGDDVVQNLPPATSDPSLRKAILPGRLHAGAFRLQTGCFEEAHHLRIELSVPIQEDVPIATGFGECLPQLLDDPLGGGMWRNVAVQNLASLVLDDEKAIQHSERHRRPKAAITSR